MRVPKGFDNVPLHSTFTFRLCYASLLEIAFKSHPEATRSCSGGTWVKVNLSYGEQAAIHISNLERMNSYLKKNSQLHAMVQPLSYNQCVNIYYLR